MARSHFQRRVRLLSRRLAGPTLSPAAVTWLGVGLNIALSATKIALGLAVGSRALFVDGLHSLSDLASDAAVLASLRVSTRPADPDHPYGHRRVQTLTAMFIGLLLLGAATWAAVSAVAGWREGVLTDYGWAPFILLLASAGLKEGLYHLTHRAARRRHDASLMANAWHHRSDAFTSLAGSLGVAGVALGGPEWGFLDHVTTLVLSGLLLGVGVKLIVGSAQELIDRAPGEHVMEGLAAVVARTRGVRGYHAIRMRQLGGKLEMDVHVQVDPHLTVRQGHDIATEVRRRVWRADPNVTTVLVHVEPATPDAQPGDPTELY